MAAWGNALGGWRRQARDSKGRFVSGKKSAKATYKAAKSRNRRNHRARMKGSVKNRGRDLKRTGLRRTRNVAGGAVVYGAGKAIGSAHISSRGVQMMKYGASANVGRVRATHAMSAGLKRSQNRAAKKRYKSQVRPMKARYKKETRKYRAIRNGIAIATTAGLGYAAYKNGNLKGGKTPKGSYYVGAVGKGRGIRVGGAAGPNTGARVFGEYFPKGKPSKFAGINANNKGGVLVYTHKGRRVLR